MPNASSPLHKDILVCIHKAMGGGLILLFPSRKQLESHIQQHPTENCKLTSSVSSSHYDRSSMTMRHQGWDTNVGESPCPNNFTIPSNYTYHIFYRNRSCISLLFLVEIEIDLELDMTQTKETNSTIDN